jgi:hypothetical protein
MTFTDVEDALRAFGWVTEPGIGWAWLHPGGRPARLAKGHALAWVSEFGVEWDILGWDGECAYERTRAIPDTYHELLELLEEMERDTRREPL